MASATIARTTVVIGGVFYDLPQTSVTIVEGKNTVYATIAGITAAAGSIARDLNTVPLWELTALNIAGNLVVKGWSDVRPLGGVGATNQQTFAPGFTPAFDPNGTNGLPVATITGGNTPTGDVTITFSLVAPAGTTANLQFKR